MSVCGSNNPAFTVNGKLLINSSGPTTVTQNGNGDTKPSIWAQDPIYLQGTADPTAYLLPGSGPATPVTSLPSDPLSNMPAPPTTGVPTYSTLAAATLSTVGGYTYVKPGVYNFNLSGNNIVLSSGIYILNNGLNASVTSGVGGDLIYLAGGSITSSSLNIWPLPLGTYADLSMWVPASNSNAIDLGPGSYRIGGIFYAPMSMLGWHGDANMWFGTLLAQGTTCNGGGNGQINVNWNQSLAFTSTPTNPTVGTQYTVTATSATPNSGNPVTYTIDRLSGSGVCSVSGSTVHFLAAGTCLVDATQAGSNQNLSSTTKPGGYLPAPTIQQSITVAAG